MMNTSRKSSTNPLKPLTWLRHLEFTYPTIIVIFLHLRLAINRTVRTPAENSTAGAGVASQLISASVSVESCFTFHNIRCSFFCSAWKMPMGISLRASARIKRHRFKIKIKSVVLIYNFSTFTHFVCSCLCSPRRTL